MEGPGRWGDGLPGHTRFLRPVLSMASPQQPGLGGPRVPPAPWVCPSLPQVDPYLPYEYTCEGMLERIHAYIQHQVGGPSTLCPRDGGATPHPKRPEEGAKPIPLSEEALPSRALCPLTSFSSCTCFRPPGDAWEWGWRSRAVVLHSCSKTRLGGAGSPALEPSPCHSTETQ